MIRFACPGCERTFVVADEKAGKVSKCPKCGASFTIPAPYVPPSPPPPPPAANDAIEIRPCPKCQSRLSVMAADVGSEIECPSCRTVYRATRADAPPPPGADTPGPVAPSSKLVKLGSGPPGSDDADEEEKPRRRRRRRYVDEDDDDEDYAPPKAIKRRRSGGRAPGTVRLTRIGPLSFGLTMGLIYAIMTLMFGFFFLVVFGCIGALFGSQFGDSRVLGYLGAGIVMGAVYILLYALAALVGGFVGGVIFAFLYNMVVRMTGGIEVELE